MDVGVSMNFDIYIEQKIRAALDANRKQGKRRDIMLLTEILNILFWERHTAERSIYDIQARLPAPYYDIKLDTLEDNLTDVLAKIPFHEPFVIISSENPYVEIYEHDGSFIPVGRVLFDKNRKPRNIYTLNYYYLWEYFENPSPWSR